MAPPPPAEPSSSERRPAGNSTQELVRFEEKLKRSLLLEEVTPVVNVPMIQTALGQFGTVSSVDILYSPLDPKHGPKRVIVEMENARQASHALKEMQERPFMIKGVPRPIRAVAAVANHFPDRPRRHSSLKRTCEWTVQGNPDWDSVCEHKRLAKKHLAEAAYMLQELRKEEEKLAHEQEEKVKENFKKLEEIDGVIREKVMHRLSRYYGLRIENGDGS